MNLSLELLRRHCAECGATHYAAVCPTCKTPTPEWQRVFIPSTPAPWRASLAAIRPNAWTPSWRQISRRALRFLENSAAAIGLAVIIASAAFWWARDDLAAWYRTLPVVVAATHCPGSK